MDVFTPMVVGTASVPVEVVGIAIVHKVPYDEVVVRWRSCWSSFYVAARHNDAILYAVPDHVACHVDFAHGLCTDGSELAKEWEYCPR